MGNPGLQGIGSISASLGKSAATGNPGLQAFGGLIWASLGKSRQVGGDGKSWSTGYRKPHLRKSRQVGGDGKSSPTEAIPLENKYELTPTRSCLPCLGNMAMILWPYMAIGMYSHFQAIKSHMNIMNVAKNMVTIWP